jgi:cytoskeletal protein RodZ
MFAFAREARGIPIEQAAHETRIRLKCLRELEADDLSHLSPAYARMFIVDYAKYLGVPTASIKSHLPDVGDFGTEGYQYIQNTASPDPEVVRLPTVRRSKSRALFVVCAFLLASFGGFKVWTIWRNLGRIQSSQVMAGEHRAVRAADLPSVSGSSAADSPQPAISDPAPTVSPDPTPEQDRVFLSTSAKTETF